MCRSSRKRPTTASNSARRRSCHAQENPHPRFRGAILAADRPPRARAAGLLRAASLRRSEAFIREFDPVGVILSGGPNSVYEARRLSRAQAVFELGVPVLGICYGMQTMAAQLGGKVEPAKKREFGYAEDSRPRPLASCSGIQDSVNAEGHGLLDVWMSHGDKVTELPPGFKVIASNEATPDRRHGRRGAPLLRRAVPPGSHPYLQGKAIIARFVRDICGCGRLEHARLRWRGRREDSFAGGQRRGDPGPFGRRRFLGRGGADPPRDRRPAHLRLRRQRAAATQRSRAGDADLCPQPRRQGRARRRSRAVHGTAGRRLRPGAEAQDHRREFVEVFQAEAGEAPQRQVAGAGHDLPRRDRIGRREDQEGAHHQEPPQRRRPARAAAT
jgi:GMP synthase (glutamine-hydrolysing) A subunit